MKLPLAVVFIGSLVHIEAGVYTDRFLAQYKKIHDPANGYFSPEGIPYHSRETLIVEAPDYGHETTSEAYSYYICLEAMNGAISGNFSSFNTAWDIMEKYIIPTSSDQPSSNRYNPSSPATFSAEQDLPSEYPTDSDPSVPVGSDPIYAELVSAYGNSDVYGMHWLQDVDNVYGFGDSPGKCSAGPHATGPSFINTFQRGPEESVWRTIPQPTCDAFKYGAKNGFLDLFIGDSSYARQWKFTNAPDADARAIQGAYWASQWASDSGQTSTILNTLAKAAKMGDYLRYSLFDKYFKRIGNCVGASSCPAGTGKNSAHYLLSWYYSWGGSNNATNGWAWRIGDGAAHFGYQNPLAAYALTSEPTMRPKGATAVADWETSLQRQLEFYTFLQTQEGAFSGGATNSWNGRYDTPTNNLTLFTFYGMYYDWEPVYHSPPSNNWFGMQAWSTDRLAQYYYQSGDAKAKSLLDKWVAWVIDNIQFTDDTYLIPETLQWSGVPGNDHHVTVESYSSDVGTASVTARVLTFYAARSGDENVKDVAKKLLDLIWTNYQTPYGVSVEESRADYSQFNESVYVPNGWIGTYPNGDIIDSSATFIKLRSWYKSDPDWPKVEDYLNGGPVPTFTYHRFWAQADVALAQGAYGLIFEE